MLLTFGEVKDSTVPNIAGLSKNSEAFRQRLNDATRKLLKRGDWSGTLVPIVVCGRQGCITWPRYVGQVRQMHFCNQVVHMRNNWFQFMEYDPRQWPASGGCLYPGCYGSASAIGQGNAPTFSDIAGEGRSVRAYIEFTADINKTVTIFGVDNNGQTLRTQVGGIWVEGWKLTLNSTYAETTAHGGAVGLVRRIDRVLKDPTQGMVRLYGYDIAAGVLEDLATYEPSETNPVYTRIKLAAPRWGCNNTTGTPGTCSEPQKIVALVKLRYIPAIADTDLVLIQNLDALKLMFQSIQEGEAGNLGQQAQFEAAAIRELNLELSDDNPEGQIPVSIQPFMGHDYGQRMY